MPKRWPEYSLSSPADFEACRRQLRSGSRSFFAASLLLPRKVWEPAGALYAFCRTADDQIDLSGEDPEAIRDLYDRLDGILAGRPRPQPLDRALADVVSHFEIPGTLLTALLEGLAWDAEGRRYETLSDLYDYAARVAGTVGALMTVIMRRRDPDVVARACDLGVAMQLTNISRDVGEDARLGRVYLPLEWFDEVGIDLDAWLAAPSFSPEVGSLVERLLERAEALYSRSASGISRLPVRCRPGIHAASIFYREIGREVEREGLDSVSRRMYVPTSRKLQLLGSVFQATMTTARRPAIPPLDEVRFLVTAVAG
ncbi:MAG: phytoene/squalene synthase family protein [Pseudomonadota bacterium]